MSPALRSRQLCSSFVRTSCSALFCAVATAQIPAFPGAEGYGSHATGGRGGDVYYVTNRNASGAGSFSEGVATAPLTGRTIVFAVSGHIRLPSGSGGGLTIAKDKITVAGQTAPGDGICFWNNTMNVSGDDLVFRFLRWRYGKQTAGGDCVDISNSQRLIFDHCDFMFSTDENLSSFGTPPEFFTFQWSINAWGLSGHSAGGLWDIDHATAHHTLWANNHTRNPKCIAPQVFDWTNNVVFGWDLGFNMAATTDPVNRINIRGSTFSHGGSAGDCIYGGGKNPDGSNIFQLHVSDSALDGSNNAVFDVSKSNYAMVSSGTTYDTINTPWPQTLNGVTGASVIGAPVTVVPRLTAYKKVLSQVGATRLEIGSRALRDEITALCVSRTASQQRGIIADPLELGLSTGSAFAALNSTVAPTDTDLDGMPDVWETSLGLSATVPNNNAVLTAPEIASSFFPSGTPLGYTQLEEYLHFKSVPHGYVARNVAASPSFIDIDLLKFTSGFTASPVFSLSNISGGSITQSGAGGSQVRFVPTLDRSGRAGFSFTVMDAQGSTWTQQCALVVTTTAAPRAVTWVGDGVLNQWNTTNANFVSLVGSTPFVSGDDVLINDSGSHQPTIKLTSAQSLAGLTVSNSSKDFTIEGGGSLSGSGGLNKSGTGTLTLRVNNSSLGGGSIDAGKVVLGGVTNIGTLPTGAITLLNDAEIVNAWPSNTSTQNIGASFVIPAGNAATLKSGRRLWLSGALTGSGDFHFVHQGTDAVMDLRGAMAAFSGRIDFSYTGTNGNMRAVFNGASFNGMGAAEVTFPAGITLSCFTNSTGNTFSIGALHGAGTLAGGHAGPPNYTIGGLSIDSTFAGSFTGNARLTKVGAAKLTLSGTSAHTGTTTVSSGELQLNGTFGATNVTVADSAIFSGNATVAGNVATNAGGILSPGADGVGLMQVGSLSLNAPLLRFDLSSNPLGSNDRISATGNVVLTDAQQFVIHLTDGVLNAGTYDLITTTGSISGTNVVFQSDLPISSRQLISIERSGDGVSPGYVRLVVVGAIGNLTWTGLNGGIWDVQNTEAWSGASPATFHSFDDVTFNDSANITAVNVTQPVRPRNVTVNNSGKAFTWSGVGMLEGMMSLLKSGSNTLTISNANTYTGSTTIAAGVINVQHANALGSSDGSTIVANNARLELQGGISVNAEHLTIVGTGGASFFNGALNSKSGVNTWAGPITIGAANTRIGAQAGATMHVSGVIDSAGEIYGITFRPNDTSASVIVSGANTYAGDTSIVGGTVKLSGGSHRLPINTLLKLGLSGVSGSLDLNGNDQELAGAQVLQSSGAMSNAITNSHASLAVLSIANDVARSYAGSITGNLSLIKKGAASLTLTGSTLSHSGGTTIQEGTLVLGGNLSSALSVESGALSLSGNRSIAGAFTLESGGVYMGQPNITLSVSGNVTVTGDLAINASPGIAAGTSWILLQKTTAGVISGNFSGKPHGSLFVDSGYLWSISYSGGDGNDIVVTTVQSVSPLESWRMSYFHSISDSGDGADLADPDRDGIVNLLEYATVQNPLIADALTNTVTKQGSVMHFTYYKNPVATDVTFTVEWNDQLSGSWSTVGVTSQQSGQVVTASIPATVARRFVRLKVTRP